MRRAGIPGQPPLGIWVLLQKAAHNRTLLLIPHLNLLHIADHGQPRQRRRRVRFVARQRGVAIPPRDGERDVGRMRRRGRAPRVARRRARVQEQQRRVPSALAVGHIVRQRDRQRRHARRWRRPPVVRRWPREDAADYPGAGERQQAPPEDGGFVPRGFVGEDVLRRGGGGGGVGEEVGWCVEDGGLGVEWGGEDEREGHEC